MKATQQHLYPHTTDSTVPEPYALRQHTDPSRRTPLICAASSRFPKRHERTDTYPPASDGSRAQHSVRLALDALCAAAPDASPRRPSIKKVDVRLAADMSTLARVPKLVGNASFLHEVALLVRTFSAEGAAVVWSRVERRDWFEGGGRAEEPRCCRGDSFEHHKLRVIAHAKTAG